MARYFKIAVSNKKDYEQLLYVLKSRIFFPSKDSNPPLPETYDEGFDYRQFFRFEFLDPADKMPVVKTRSEYTVNEFNTLIVKMIEEERDEFDVVTQEAVSEWIDTYYLSENPVITEFEHSDVVNGWNRRTHLDVFLSYTKI
jgi:hypothetical protein